MTDPFTPEGRQRLDELGREIEAGQTGKARRSRANIDARLVGLLRQGGIEPYDEVAAEAAASLLRAELARASFVRPPGPIFCKFLALLGILLPLACLIATDAVGLGDLLPFDPVPTPWHYALVSLVPCAALYFLVVFRRQRSTLAIPRWAALLIGAALAANAAYALAFGPLAPFALLFVFARGAGLLGLAPLLSLCVLVPATWKLLRLADPRRPRLFAHLLLGAGASAGLLVFLEAPVHLFALDLTRLTSGTPEQRERVLSRWRQGAQRSLLERAAAGGLSRRSGVAWPLFRWTAGGSRGIQTGWAQRAWYQVTGEVYAGPLLRSERSDWWEFDATEVDLGPSTDSVVGSDLLCTHSALEGAVDSSSTLAYLEWTFEFRAARPARPREARVLLELPDEAVVTRATLWVEGEPREAAFASPGTAQRAYDQIARVEGRDPLLVSFRGDDRVLLQGFPVQYELPLRVRIGMAVPLELDAQGASFRLPRWIESNVDSSAGLQVALDLRSDVPLRIPDAGLEIAASRGSMPARIEELPAARLQDSSESLRVQLDDASRESSAWSASGAEWAWVVHFDPLSAEVPDAPLLVLDTSLALGEHAEELTAALEAVFGAQAELDALLARDTGYEERRGVRARELIAGAAFAGGRNNGPALAQGMLEAQLSKRDLLWICGPQPLHFAFSEREWTTDLEGDTHFAALTLGPGTNVLLDQAELRAHFERHVVERSVEDGLRRAVGRPAGGVLRRYAKARVSQVAGVHRAPEHLSDLAVAAEVDALLRANPPKTLAALGLAREAAIVTAISSAVALESDAQLAQAGLAAESIQDVPSVPEPSTYLLALVSLGALLWVARGARRA